MYQLKSLTQSMSQHVTKFSLALTLLFTQQANAQTTLVGWDGAAFDYEVFDIVKGDFRNPYANTGITGNKDISKMQTFGGVSPATASDAIGDGNQVIFNQNPDGFSPKGPGEGWINGSGVKGYSFSFKTTGFKTLKFSGKIAASRLSFGFYGARDFKLQYSTNGTSWADVTSGTMTAGLMNGTTLTFNTYNNIALPASLDNLATVYLRLIMTSNNAVTSGTATTQGMVYLDDIKVTADIGLPITYENLGASVKNNILSVNWSTASETNNDHFDIQASADGQNFTTITQVTSKAVAGNSNQVLEYQLSFDMTTNTLLAGIPALLALLALGGYRKRWARVASIVGIGGLTLVASCSKQDAVSIDTKNTPAYIRIVQVDKDGSSNVSKVIKVTLN